MGDGQSPIRGEIPGQGVMWGGQPPCWIPPPGSCRQVPPDALRRGEQRVEQVAHDAFQAAPARVRGHVDGGDHPAVAVPDRRGERAQPLFQLLVHQRPAAAADLAQLLPQPAGAGDGAPGQAVQADSGQVPLQPVLRLGREQHAPHRRRVGGEAGADADRHRHDPLGRDAGDVDDVFAVEFGHGGGLADLLDELLHVRHRDLGEGQAGQVGVPELEDLGAQREPAVVAPHVAEVHQGVQETAGRRAAEPGGGRDLGEAEAGVVGVEGPDHGKAAVEGLDEVAVLLIDRGFIRHAQPPAAPAALPGQTCRTGAGRGVGGGVICQMITIVDSSLPVRLLNYRA